jgi:choline dehydrogenase
MGRADDPLAVVDPECRVIGVEGLRVADSSIFPHVTYGNLNGPSIMTGEKGSRSCPRQDAPAPQQSGTLGQSAGDGERSVISGAET